MRGASERVAAAGVGAPGVDEAWPRVVRLAYLLTADHGTAEELAVAAFVRRRGGGGRRAADPRRLVLTLPSSPAWQLRVRQGARPEPHDPLLRAYLTLPVRERALLVLRLGEGLDGPAAAAVLGLPSEGARARTVAAMDALRVALPTWTPSAGSAAGRVTGGELDLGEIVPPPPGDDVTAAADPLAGDPVVPPLEVLFGELAAATPVVADPGRRVEAAVARARDRRRRLAAVAATLVVAVAATAVVVTERHAAAVAEQLRAERQRAAYAALHPRVEDPDVTAWPTRGSLAGRGDLIAQVRATAADAGSSVLAVPFVGEVDALDVALVVDSGGDEPGNARVLTAFTRPASPSAAPWTPVDNAFHLDDGEGSPVPVLSAALTDPAGRTRVVVVTVSSGVTAAYSQRPLIDAQGVVTRQYTALALEDGVATATWQGQASAALLRVGRGEEPAVIGPIRLTHDRRPARVPVPWPVAPTCRGEAFSQLRLNLDNAGVAAADQVGREPDEIARVRGVGCRRVGDHDVMFVAVQLADGTALQTVLEDVQEKDSLSFPQHELRSVPRGRDTTYPRSARLVSFGATAAGAVARTVLFCGPGAATAELVRRSPGGEDLVVAKARLGPDGVGVGRAAAPLDDDSGTEGDTFSVVLEDDAGRRLARVPSPAGHSVGDIEPEGLGPAGAAPAP